MKKMCPLTRLRKENAADRTMNARFRSMKTPSMPPYAAVSDRKLSPMSIRTTNWTKCSSEFSFARKSASRDWSGRCEADVREIVASCSESSSVLPFKKKTCF